MNEHTQEAAVVERMTILRLEHPEEDNWLAHAYPEHDEGSCVECDALRRLHAEQT